MSDKQNYLPESYTRLNTEFEREWDTAKKEVKKLKYVMHNLIQTERQRHSIAKKHIPFWNIIKRFDEHLQHDTNNMEFEVFYLTCVAFLRYRLGIVERTLYIFRAHSQIVLDAGKTLASNIVAQHATSASASLKSFSKTVEEFKTDVQEIEEEVRKIRQNSTDPDRQIELTLQYFNRKHEAYVDSLGMRSRQERAI